MSIKQKIKEYIRSNFFDDVSVNVGVPGYNPPVTMVRSKEQAMRVATAFRCTDILSGDIASLDIRVKKRVGDMYIVDDKHPLNKILNIKPNNRMTAFDLFKNAVIQMLNEGNAYLLPQWNLKGDVESIVLLTPGSVAYDKLNNFYQVNDIINGIHETIDGEDIIHLKNMSLDGGYTGVSVINYASQTLSLSASADRQCLETFQSGGKIEGFVSGETELTKGFGVAQDNQLKDASDVITNAVTSGKKIFSIPGGVKFNPLSLSPVDAQLLDNKKFSVFDICRFYGVHPDKVFAGEKENYKASGMSQELYIEDTLIQRLSSIANELTVKLIPDYDLLDYKIEFDVTSKFDSDPQKEAVYIEKTIASGVYTVNYWRKLKGQQPIEGGDDILVSCNLANINSDKIKGVPPKTE